MSRNFDILMSLRCMLKAYTGVMKSVCDKYNLTSLEAKVVTFLHNNPELNTAGDIAQYRMLSKGNVSQAVEKLIQKGCMEREPDQADRRRVYLHLLPAAEPITKDIDAKWDAFCDRLYAGFTDEEIAQYDRYHSKLMKNAKDIVDWPDAEGEDI